LANCLRLSKIIRRQQVSDVHAATLLPEGFLAWMIEALIGRRYLVFIHGEELAVAASSRQLSWMANRVISGADRIIANSKNTRELILRRWPACEAKVAVVTPGVDTAQFKPADHNAQVRQRLGWTGRRVILTVGRLQARKGHDRLIEALPLIRRDIPDVLYAIVGSGERQQELQSLAEKHGVIDHVKFHGALADQELIECYQQCDLMALPNREINGDIEGFGMVLLEAQACGRPVLAGISGGTAETLRDGETGRLVACDHAEPLANVLVEMLSDADKLDRMGVAARQWAIARFDWPNVAALANEVFSQLAAIRGSRLKANTSIACTHTAAVAMDAPSP
jgi:phosphatidylinositol alpha-1,6-mannosyltransferase